ncbi:MAG TPA: OmpA family protein [Hyphomicrobiaceae bacterium]|nr:OmpA family protein [Hyphomicrobiaceae bacterium]
MLRWLIMIVLLAAAGALAFVGAFRVRLLPLDNETERAELSAKKDGAPPASGTRPPEDAAAVTATKPADRGPEPGQAPASKPVFDIARISPDGSSVLAGRAAPFDTVTVLEDGKPVGTAKADENGEWSLVTEHKFTSADPQLALHSEPGAAPGPDAPLASAVAPGTGAVSKPPASPIESPTKHLMKEFEELVAAARKETGGEDREASRSAEPGASPAGTSAPETLAAAREPREEPTIAAPPPQRIAEARPRLGEATSVTAPPATSILVPMTFVYDEATLTEDGRHAAELLSEYLKLKRFSAVTLTGHADERGTQEYNLDLSRQRLDTVERQLRAGGFAGKLELVPKGKSEPFTGVDRTKYALEDIYQLDRRVELRVAH